MVKKFTEDDHDDAKNALDIADQMITAIRERYPNGVDYVTLAQILGTLVGQALYLLDTDSKKHRLLTIIRKTAPKMADYFHKQKEKKKKPTLH